MRLFVVAFLHDSEPRLSTKAFWNHSNPSDDLVFKFCFSSKFDDRLCRGDVIYVVATIIFISGVSDLEV